MTLTIDKLHDGLIAGLVDGWFGTEDPALQRVRGHLQLERFPAGRQVFARGDQCSHFVVVVSGSLRVSACSSADREVFLYRVADGESCAITTACLVGGEAYPVSGVVESETALLRIPRAVFLFLLGRSAAFREFLPVHHGKRFGELIQRIADVGAGQVDARLARLLLDRAGTEDGAIAVTHRELANQLGTAREVVSRQLKVFEKQGWIRVLRGRVIVLRPQGLAGVAQGPG